MSDVAGTAVATRHRVNLNAPEPSPRQNDTLFRIDAGTDDHTRFVDPSGIDAFGSEAPDPEPGVRLPEASAPHGDGGRRVSTLVRTLLVLALVQGLVIAALVIARPDRSVTGSGRLVIESDPVGADVWLDGRHLGTTPLSLISDAGMRSVRIEAQGASSTMNVDVANGQVTHARVDYVLPSAPVAPGTPTRDEVREVVPDTAATVRPEAYGWIDVPSGLPLDVYENGRKVGTATNTNRRLRLVPGAHSLEFVNEELGVRVRTNADVQPGMVTPVSPALPRGTLAINAEPWAEVWLDGQPLGETPIGEVPSDLGLHEVVFRHPELGERRTQVRVAANAPAHVTVDLR